MFKQLLENIKIEFASLKTNMLPTHEYQQLGKTLSPNI